MDKHYEQQVRLLLRVLPFVAEEPCFALKGGTAINLFVLDLPRLSVDIDLVYLPLNDREISMTKIIQALDRLASRLQKTLPGVTCAKAWNNRPDALRVVVRQSGVSIKVELSPVLRGTVLDARTRAVTPRVESRYGFAEMQVLDPAELYAGKLCAAFDRQHPRDAFDVLLLLENNGLNRTVRQIFIVYLLSHSRPMEELLAPRWKPLDTVFKTEFAQMTTRTVSADELESALQTALTELKQGLTTDEKRFI